jgi:hypothetical protein
MPPVTAAQAAELIGKHRSTISRAIEKGHLSAGRDEFGRHLIDPAELERVYGPLRNPDAHDAVRADAEQQDANDLSVATLTREVELLREMLERERRVASDTLERERTNHDRDRHSWEEERTFLRGMLEKQAEQVRLLTDQREREPARSPSIWARLFRQNA